MLSPAVSSLDQALFTPGWQLILIFNSNLKQSIQSIL